MGGIGQAPTGVRRVGAATSTAKVAPAADVAVAVLDTGVDLSHTDLNVVHGTNCINTAALANDGHGHGSHCAGERRRPNCACVHTCSMPACARSAKLLWGPEQVWRRLQQACCKLAVVRQLRMPCVCTLHSWGCCYHRAP